MRLTFTVIGVLVVLVIVMIFIYGPAFRRFNVSSIESLDPLLTVWLGAGGNSMVLRSEDGSEVLVVDTKMGRGSRDLRAYVDSVAEGAEITVVNTHTHSDHTRGNNLFLEAQFITGAHDDTAWKRGTAMDRLPDERIAVGNERVIMIGEETVRIRNIGRAHSWNDVVVYLENRKLLATGDVVFHRWHPALIKADGSHVGMWTAALDTLIGMYQIDTVVPGHGSIADASALTGVRDYFMSIRDALGDKTAIRALRKTYQEYFSMPLMMTFNRTKRIMASEK